MIIQELEMEVSLIPLKTVHLMQFLPEKSQDVSFNPRALVIGIHGFGDHAGRYRRLAEATFTALDCIFYMPDLPGHGLTKGARGLTNFADIEVVVRETVSYASAQYPNVPLILFGHSMGGGVVLDILTQDHLKQNGGNSAFSAAIVTSPWLKPFIEPKPWLVATGWLLSKIKPDFTLNAKLNLADLTDDLSIQEETARDSLYHNLICYALYSDMRTSGLRNLKESPCLDLPLLLMIGGKDRIASPDANRDLAKRMKTSATLSYWPDLRHELHNCKGREDVYQTINHFLLSILPE